MAMSTRIQPDRACKSKSKPQKIPNAVFNATQNAVPPLVVKYKANKTAKPIPEAKEEKKESKSKKKATTISRVYWHPNPKGDDFVTEVSWFGLGSSRFDHSMTELLNYGTSTELAQQCQMKHVKYKEFTQWYKARAHKRQQMLVVGNTAYDFGDKKYYVVDSLPTEDQLYVWEGYDNYFVGYAFEFDPTAKIIGSGDGVIPNKQYELYSEEIVIIQAEDLGNFYFKQMAKDDLYQSFDDALFGKFYKSGRARPLKFYEKVMGKCWNDFIKQQLIDNDIEYEEYSSEKKWTLSFEQANEVFPKGDGSHFERLWGRKRHFIEDMDFIFNTKKNKLRIYSVVLIQDTITKNVNGRTIEKRR